MKNALIFGVTVSLLFNSCISKEKMPDKLNFLSFIEESLARDSLSGGNNPLCLVIGDNMCMECIAKEYINLRKNNIKVIAVGFFDSKRTFYASTNELFFIDRVYIDKNKCAGLILPEHPIYLVFNKTDNSFDDLFYPHPDEIDKTEKYFEDIANEYFIQ
jgi:hypothetical protein